MEARRGANGMRHCDNSRIPGVCAAVALALVALAAAGCSDRMLDTGAFRYVTGDAPPPPAPGPVRSMTGEDTMWPNLATVPPRPTDIPSLEQRRADLERLRQSRADNRDAARSVREDPRLPVQPVPVEPVPVPPPANLTPGKPSV